MKPIIAVILLMCLLSGCAARTPVQQPEEKPTELSQVVEPTEKPFAEYRPADRVEVLTHGAVKYYALDGLDFYAMMPMGNGIVLISGGSNATLTYADPDGSVIVNTFDASIHPEDAAFHVTERGISYYDSNAHALVFLDKSLQETSRITMPQDMGTYPVLSEDWQWVYYYDATSLRCLELRSGISRLLKESRYESQFVSDILFNGEILVSQVYDGLAYQTLFISTENGETKFVTPGQPELITSGQAYFAHWQESDQQMFLFGTRGGSIQRITPLADEKYLPVLNGNALVTYAEDSTGTDLTHYDLSEGQNLSNVRLSGIGSPISILADPQKGGLWMLASDLQSQKQGLYYWDPDIHAQSVENSYLSAYYTAQSPDTDGLARCKQRADALAEEYGIRIRIWEDAQEHIPKDYSATAEHLVSTYDRCLPILEKTLSSFPKDIYKKLGRKSQNGKLTVSLVREIYGANELGSLTLERGVHYWDNGSSYLLIMMDDQLEQNFYHELFHAMDSYVLTETKVYDDWRKLNPSGFAYDYSYITNEYRDPKDYLDPKNRAFIDLYSMSYPKEDRARIMEYAMMEGNASYFTSKTMEKKLETLCKGIRRAFNLGDDQTYVWEQYL